MDGLENDIDELRDYLSSVGDPFSDYLRLATPEEAAWIEALEKHDVHDSEIYVSGRHKGNPSKKLYFVYDIPEDEIPEEYRKAMH